MLYEALAASPHLLYFADFGTHALKGFAEPIQAWRVLGEGLAEGRFEALVKRAPYGIYVHSDGRIVYATERLDSGFHGTSWSKLPLLRGLDKTIVVRAGERHVARERRP